MPYFSSGTVGVTVSMKFFEGGGSISKNFSQYFRWKATNPSNRCWSKKLERFLPYMMLIY